VNRIETAIKRAHPEITILFVKPQTPETWQRRRAALSEGAEDAPMVAGEPCPVRLTKTIAVSAHDVGHLEGRPHHRSCNRRDL